MPGTVLKTEFGARPPTSFGEMLQIAQRIGNSEATAQPDNHRTDGGQRSQDNKSTSSNRTANSVPDRQSRPQRDEVFTLLDTSRAEILTVLKRDYNVPPPQPMNPRATQHRDSSRFCAFHNDVGHTTEEYLALRRAIEKLIKEEYLQQYRADVEPNQGPVRNGNNNNNIEGPR